MNRRKPETHSWIKSCASTALMGLSALIGMLALEFLMTGNLSAAKGYIFIAATITCCLVAMQWRHYRAQPRKLMQQRPFECPIDRVPSTK